MPFKSEKQRRYLWANEPEIARDWTDTYGSKIKKAQGGRIGFSEGGWEAEWDEIYEDYKLKQIKLGKEFVSKEEFIDMHRDNNAQGGRIGYYTGGQSIPSEYTVEDARKTAMQDKLGGITDIMKKADLYRQGDIGQMYMADGGRMGGIMGSNAGSMLVTPTRDGSRPGYYGPDAGHENDPGHGANAPGDDHSYKTHHPNIHAGMKTQNVVTPSGDVFATGDPMLSEKQDYFTQTYSGQPNFLGFGGGYRTLKTPNDAGSNYRSRLNPMGLMSLLGRSFSMPFTLAKTGIDALRNKFGPAFNNFTSSKTLEQFRDKMRGYGRTMPTYSPYLKFGGIENLLKQEMPEETNIDNSMYGGDQDIFGVENARGLFRPHQMSTDFNIKYGPEGITYYEDEDENKDEAMLQKIKDYIV